MKRRNFLKSTAAAGRASVTEIHKAAAVVAAVLFGLFGAGCTAMAQVQSAAVAARSATDPAVITALAADAYIWGLGPEYIWRFSKYNTIIGAPFNAFKYGSVPAAWNNEATNGGDASVVYVSGFVNFDQSPELVLTVPPSRNQYYVVAYYGCLRRHCGEHRDANDPFRDHEVVSSRRTPVSICQEEDRED